MIIQPVATDMYHQGWEPLQKNEITTGQAFDAGAKPLKTFMMRFAREKDVALFRGYLPLCRRPATRRTCRFRCSFRRTSSRN